MRGDEQAAQDPRGRQRRQRDFERCTAERPGQDESVRQLPQEAAGDAIVVVRGRRRQADAGCHVMGCSDDAIGVVGRYSGVLMSAVMLVGKLSRDSGRQICGKHEPADDSTVESAVRHLGHPDDSTAGTSSDERVKRPHHLM